MNREEKMEIESKVPPKYQPIGAWSYFWLNILYTCIPVVGFIFLIIHAIGASKVAVRSYARSFFCGIVLALIVVAVVVVVYMFTPIGDMLKGLLDQLMGA